MPIALRTLGVNARRWHPIRLPPVKAAHCFEDGKLDFVFIDGEYSYGAAKSDIEAWWPKVRSGGLFWAMTMTGSGFRASAGLWMSLVRGMEVRLGNLVTVFGVYQKFNLVTKKATP